MRTPRDILVAGIGFLLGMVSCYFMIGPKPASEVSKIAVNQAQTLPIFRTSVADVPTVPVEKVFFHPNAWNSRSDPNWWLQPNGTHPRIVPALGNDGVYDLIDLNYVPDFKIDLD